MSEIQKARPFQATGADSESRVVPAAGATIARRDPMIRLNNVDFPTLGRPTSTTEAGFRDIAVKPFDHLASALTA